MSPIQLRFASELQLPSALSPWTPSSLHGQRPRYAGVSSSDGGAGLHNFDAL